MDDPGMDPAASGGDPSRFAPVPSVTSSVRIGDAEREHAASVLSDNYAAGRLDHDEFEARLSAVYRATTAAEVNRWFADLPGPVPVNPPTQPANGADPRSRAAGRPAYARPAVVPMLVVAIVVVVGMSMVTDGRFPWFIFLPIMWFSFGGRRLRRSWNHNWRS
jgi:Domain of unknown function (DUF1707)